MKPLKASGSGRRVRKLGRYSFLGGSQVGFFNWNAGEPNNVGADDYIHFKANTGNWNYIIFTVPSGGYAVEFSLTAGAIPKAPIWAMLLGGMGLVCTALRRRGGRKTVAA